MRSSAPSATTPPPSSACGIWAPSGRRGQRRRALPRAPERRESEHTQKVWASTDELLSSADPSTLDKRAVIKPLGEMPAIQALGPVGLTHGRIRFGEIELIPTLLGAGPVTGV